MEYVPTTQELERKATGELQTIFRQATCAAADTKALPARRAAASLTVVKVRICLAARLKLTF